MTTRRELLRSVVMNATREPAVCPQPPLSAFVDPLQCWVKQRCVYRDRCYAGVHSLHADYVDWCRFEAMEVPCSLTQFKEWLACQSFQLDVSGFVYGLILKTDLAASGVTVH